LEQFWGFFGYLHLRTPVWVQEVGQLLLYAAVVGLVASMVAIAVYWLRGRRPSPVEIARQVPALTVLLLVVVTTWIGVAMYELRPVAAAQGRYAFVALVPLGVFAARGLAGLVPRRAGGLIVGLVACLMVAVNLYCLFGVVVPFYY
jgi:hypothetical protein